MGLHLCRLMYTISSTPEDLTARLQHSGVGPGGGSRTSYGLPAINGDHRQVVILCLDSCSVGLSPTWTWNKSLMRSSGAVTVLAVAPATPPATNILNTVSKEMR